MSEILRAALRYAADGVAVFPTRLYVRGDGRKGVRPIPDWDTASTTDPLVIRRWFGPEGTYEDAALCIDCGKSGIVGIDQDVHEGKDGVTAWAALAGDQVSSWRVRTPTGGLHDYFRADPNRSFTVDNVGTVADGVDVRSVGGFLFAPPSIDPRGGAWEWVDGVPVWAALPPVPEVVVSRMLAKESARRPKAPERVMPAQDGSVHSVQPRTELHGTSDLGEVSSLFGGQAGQEDFGPDGGWKTRADAVALLAAERAAFEALTEPGSSRSHLLSQRYGVLAGHGVGVFWTYEQALDILMASCEANGFSDTNGATYALGQAQRGLEYGMRQPWHELVGGVGASELDAATAPTAGRLRSVMLRRSEIHTLPDPVPLIRDVLHEKSIMMLTGKFGTYKSFVAIDWACCLATGKPWMGHEVPRAVPVIYAAAEGASGIKKRLNAWEVRNGAVPDTFVLIPVAVRLTRPEDVAELSSIIEETGARVVIYDTLHASTPGMDENDSGQVGEIMDVIRGLRDRHGVTTILPHHTGHVGDRARGSSSIEDDADEAFNITIKGEDRAETNPRIMRHRKSKDEAKLPAFQLKLELVEGTGSAVVTGMGDGYTPAEFDIETFDALPWAGQQPQDWTARLTNPKAKWQRRILQALYDHGGQTGLTRAECKAVVSDRWEDPGRGSAYTDAWQKVKDMDVAVNVRGERWSVDFVQIEAIRLE